MEAVRLLVQEVCLWPVSAGHYVNNGIASGPDDLKDKSFLVTRFQSDRLTGLNTWEGGKGALQTLQWWRVVPWRKLLAAPSSLLSPRVFGCHFGYVSRRYSDSISCHHSGCCSDPRVGSRSASILALVSAPQWLCFGVGGGVSLWLCFSKVSPSLPLFSFSTPGSWPPARHADQWEIQAQAFCLGWHFAFVFPSRL